MKNTSKKKTTSIIGMISMRAFREARALSTTSGSLPIAVVAERAAGIVCVVPAQLSRVALTSDSHDSASHGTGTDSASSSWRRVP